MKQCIKTELYGALIPYGRERVNGACIFILVTILVIELIKHHCTSTSVYLYINGINITVIVDGFV